MDGGAASQFGEQRRQEVARSSPTKGFERTTRGRLLLHSIPSTVAKAMEVASSMSREGRSKFRFPTCFASGYFDGYQAMDVRGGFTWSISLATCPVLGDLGLMPHDDGGRCVTHDVFGVEDCGESYFREGAICSRLADANQLDVRRDVRGTKYAGSNGLYFRYVECYLCLHVERMANSR